mmetsp:Transcript_21887/g.43433  ORF Transcript_21887/g.43433 Transcript_21887/m.43433 type:complete len:118 (+) Transcript_21887:503-856(+)
MILNNTPIPRQFPHTQENIFDEFDEILDAMEHKLTTRELEVQPCNKNSSSSTLHPQLAGYSSSQTLPTEKRVPALTSASGSHSVREEPPTQTNHYARPRAMTTHNAHGYTETTPLLQ